MSRGWLLWRRWLPRRRRRRMRSRGSRFNPRLRGNGTRRLAVHGRSLVLREMGNRLGARR
jgi:hypothetical protein